MRLSGITNDKTLGFGTHSPHYVALPGSSGAPVGFLMYPQAEAADGRLDCLDPDGFKYEITTKATTAANS